MVWYIFDSEKHVQQQMSEELAFALIRDLPKEKHAQILVWKEGWPDWRRLETAPEVIVAAFAALESTPIPPPISQNHLEPKSLAGQQPKSGEKRKSPRQTIEARVLVTCDDGAAIFRSVSEDISITGIRLRHSIPVTFINKNLHIHITHPGLKSRLRLKVQLVGSSSDPLRFSFAGQTTEDQTKIQNWLNAYNKINRKKAA